MSASWNWKNKDGSTPGLLYESGNWGDLLKMLWLKTVMDWKQIQKRTVNYLDLFAGDIVYPLTPKARYRIKQTGANHFAFLQKEFLANNLWPSAASGIRPAVNGVVEVFDADPGRREKWGGKDDITVLDGESGWEILAEHDADPNAVWLVDPYDFLAEWREYLGLIVEKSRATTILLYLYNRSAKSERAFKNYRDFKNALEDIRPDRKCMGRIAADPFLPRSHHEMLFLPNEEDISKPTFPQLLDDLAIRAFLLAQALTRTAVCEYTV